MARLAAKPGRTQEMGALRTILTMLAWGPHLETEIVEDTSGSRRQVLAVLAYAKRWGYVSYERAWPCSYWRITPEGRERLKALGGS